MPIILPPSTPDEAGWEEIYGPDYPYSWLAPGAALDTPVLQNQLCRLTYDSTHTNGFRIDRWDTASSGWVQQGKVIVQRGGDGGLVFPELVSAAVMEWSPDRAVVALVMSAPADARSRERVLITLQRGWTGPRFEVYPAPKADGSAPTVALQYYRAIADPNDSLLKIDAVAAIAATAGTGSALFASSGTPVGDSTFSGENELVLLGQATGVQTNFAVVQEQSAAQVFSDNVAYGSARNCVEVFSSVGYLSVHMGFCPQAADQVIEAESCRNGSSTTASVVSDSGASGGSAVKDTQATAAVLSTWKATDLRAGVYRVIARVKVNLDLDLGEVKISNSTGFVQREFSNTAWEWIDFGDLTFTVDDDGLGAYVLADSGGAYLDRIELFLLEDRTGTAATFGAARDLGQSVLYDARVDPRRVQRAGT